MSGFDENEYADNQQDRKQPDDERCTAESAEYISEPHTEQVPILDPQGCDVTCIRYNARV